MTRERDWRLLVCSSLENAEKTGQLFEKATQPSDSSEESLIKIVQNRVLPANCRLCHLMSVNDDILDLRVFFDNMKIKP